MDTNTNRIDWNKCNNVYSLKPLAYTHTKRTRVLCPSTLMWYSLQVTCGVQVYTTHQILMQFCTNTQAFIKYSFRVTKTHMLPTCVFKV